MKYIFFFLNLEFNSTAGNCNLTTVFDYKHKRDWLNGRGQLHVAHDLQTRQQKIDFHGFVLIVVIHIHKQQATPKTNKL